MSMIDEQIWNDVERWERVRREELESDGKSKEEIDRVIEEETNTVFEEAQQRTLKELRP